MRELFSKDGAKIIKQFVSKDGNGIMQVFDKANNMLIHSEITKKSDNSILSKVLNYMTGKAQVFALQKLEQNNSTMSVLFKTNFQNPKDLKIKDGEFFHCVSGKLEQKASVSYNPVNKGIRGKNMLDNKLYTETNIFNSKQKSSNQTNCKS